MPGGCQGAGFRFPVTDHAGNDQPGIVKSGAKGMTQGITQLAPLVNRSGSRRGHVARDTAGKGKLLEQLLESGFILGHVGVHLTPGAFQVHVAHDCRATVTGSGDVEHIQVILVDHPVQMHVDEILAGCRAPMADDERLDVGQLQGSFQQRIVIEVDLSDRYIIRGAPVSIDPVEQFRRESAGCHGSGFLFSSACTFAKRRRWRGASLK